MFGQVGTLEIVVVLIIALVVLGPKRLPEVARSVGRGVRELREAMSGEGDDDDEDDDEFEHLPAPEKQPGPAGEKPPAPPAAEKPPDPVT